MHNSAGAERPIDTSVSPEAVASAVRYRRTAALLVTLVLLLPTWSGEAHEIPADVTLQAFVRPEGATIRMLVRAPLAAMRDYNFTTREPGYLELGHANTLIGDAATEWVANYLEMYEGGQALGIPTVAAARIAIPGDRAFRSYEGAIENVRAEPLPLDTELPLQQAMLDVLLEWPIESEVSDFSIDPRVAHLGIRTVTVLRFQPAGGAERAFQYTGNPGLVRLDPRWHQASWRFIQLGFAHILDGIDHLLFLLCLVVPFRNFWALVPIVTAFTVAHSITLIASAFGLAPNALWFPALIETLIALSIVFMAFENIVGARLHRRWMMAFAFGLIHGFGFSFALSESLQFAGAHLLTSLLSFNIGVEFGQLFVLVLAVPILDLLLRKVVPEVAGVIVLSAVLAHTGWHWMMARGGELVQYQFVPPALDAAFAARVMRWMILVLIIVGTVWGLRGGYAWVSKRFPGRERPRSPA